MNTVIWIALLIAAMVAGWLSRGLKRTKGSSKYVLLGGILVSAAIWLVNHDLGLLFACGVVTGVLSNIFSSFDKVKGSIVVTTAQVALPIAAFLLVGKLFEPVLLAAFGAGLAFAAQPLAIVTGAVLVVGAILNVPIALMLSIVLALSCIILAKWRNMRGVLVSVLMAALVMYIAGMRVLDNKWFGLAGLVGIVLAGAWLFLMEFFSNPKFRPVKSVVNAGQEQAVKGLLVGVEATIIPLALGAVALVASYLVGAMAGNGVTGVLMAAAGFAAVAVVASAQGIQGILGAGIPLIGFSLLAALMARLVSVIGESAQVMNLLKAEVFVGLLAGAVLLGWFVRMMRKESPARLVIWTLVAAGACAMLRADALAGVMVSAIVFGTMLVLSSWAAQVAWAQSDAKQLSLFSGQVGKNALSAMLLLCLLAVAIGPFVP